MYYENKNSAATNIFLNTVFVGVGGMTAQPWKVYFYLVYVNMMH